MRSAHDRLLEQTPSHELHTARDSLVVKSVVFTQLGQQLLRPLDRSGNQLGKERDVGCEVTEVILRRLLAADTPRTCTPAFEMCRS